MNDERGLHIIFIRHSLRRSALAAAALSLQVLVATLLALDGWPTARMIAGTAYVLLVPGWSMVNLLHLDDPTLELAGTVTVSVTLATLAGMALIWADRWSAGAALGVLAAVTTPGLLVQLAAGAVGRDGGPARPSPSDGFPPR